MAFPLQISQQLTDLQRQLRSTGDWLTSSHSTRRRLQSLARCIVTSHSSVETETHRVNTISLQECIREARGDFQNELRVLRARGATPPAKTARVNTAEAAQVAS